MVLLRCLLAAIALAWLGPATAQGGVTGPIQIVSGFAPGGTTDQVLRRIAVRLAEQLGTGVVVENRPGASGTIAAAAVARAAPDGRTLLFGVAANLAVAPATMKSPPYDATRAFTPIIEVARGPYVWLVRSDAPAATLPEFIAWTRSRPGQLNYASPGLGSVHHIATEMLKLATGMDLVHIPYRGNMYQALMAGDVHAMFESLPAPLPHLASGRLRALAVTGGKRLDRLPDVPTLTELGIKDMEMNSWWGFVGPAGMPPAMVARLNSEFQRAMADPELMATMAGWGIELSPGSPAEFGAHIGRENARWKADVGRIGLAAQ